MVRMVDITFESTPVGASTWTVPEASGNFCTRGGRFGAHSSHESFTPIYYGRVLFVTFFNAGLRALDIRDPFNVKEIGHYIPATTANTDRRCVGEGANERCKVAIQSNNVEVDDRGYVVRRRSREYGPAHPRVDRRARGSPTSRNEAGLKTRYSAR